MTKKSKYTIGVVVAIVALIAVGVYISKKRGIRMSMPAAKEKEILQPGEVTKMQQPGEIPKTQV
jgi:hypothetical protein